MPTRMTQEMQERLAWCFAQDMNHVQAMAYCGLDQNCFYRFLKKNPKIGEYWNSLRNKPALHAKIAVAAKLKAGDDAEFCLNYLKLKDPDFKERKQIDVQEVPQIVDDVK